MVQRTKNGSRVDEVPPFTKEVRCCTNSMKPNVPC